VGEPAQARCFLEHDLRGLGDPYAMRDMRAAVDLVERALTNGALIRVYGDYDVDGVCATALVVRALRGLGGQVDWYIPHRVEEGYGLNEDAVRQASRDGVRLLVTVDCGCTAVHEVALARSLGMEVVVTDHHRPEKALPDAPVLNPWRDDCSYPFKDLAGVGVAFKLVSALARERGLREGAELRFLDLVCLGTVGDVVPLLGENRLFVQHGLRLLPKSPKAGVGALVAAAGIGGEVGSRHVAFALAPRINAAGRMEHAQAAVRLLLTDDAEEARALAAELSAHNDRRRRQEQDVLAEAEEMIAREVDLSRDKVIVLGSEGWHPGVIGIVASRLVERHHRPVLLVAVSDGAGKGSGRSIEAFNLWQALHDCAPLLTRYGGHHYAAGFGVTMEQMDALRRRMNEIGESWLTPEDLVRHVDVDAEAGLDELGREAVSELNRLAPFGHGNPAPVVVTRALRVTNVARVGDGSHLSLALRQDGGATVGAIWFGHGRLGEELSVGARVDVCHRPQLDDWQGTARVRLRVSDVGVYTGDDQCWN
jgi:single-stranded-DNA-specific exonuclease